MTTRIARPAALVAALTIPLLALGPSLLARAAVPAAHPHATVAVAIQNFAFSPATITIAPGTTVVWTQKDSAPHTVTSDDNAFPASSQLSSGQTYSYTFTKPGRYTYHCAVHPFMKATVIVTGSASGGSQSGGTKNGHMNGSGSGMASMGPRSTATTTAWTGYYDGHKVQYLSTDTSSKAEAQHEHINYAPGLTAALPYAAKMYIVTNGRYASRGPAFGSEPGERDYTPLWQEVLVTWKNPGQAVFLSSDNAVNAMAKAGKVKLTLTGIVLNCPIIKVEGGL